MKKNLTKWVTLIATIFGKSSMFVYGCELFADLGEIGMVYPVAIPVSTLKTVGLGWFIKLYEKRGKAQSEIIKGLRNLAMCDNSIVILEPIPVSKLDEIKEKYGLANYGYAFEQYFVEKGCKHGDVEDDKENKRDVYIKHYWTAGRKTARGCQLKCSIRQSVVNF